MATGNASDMPMVSGEESRDEHNEIGVILKSLDSELTLSARDMPFDDMLEANDFERGL